MAPGHHAAVGIVSHSCLSGYRDASQFASEILVPIRKIHVCCSMPMESPHVCCKLAELRRCYHSVCTLAAVGDRVCERATGGAADFTFKNGSSFQPKSFKMHLVLVKKRQKSGQIRNAGQSPAILPTSQTAARCR